MNEGGLDHLATAIIDRIAFFKKYNSSGERYPALVHASGHYYVSREELDTPQIFLPTIYSSAASIKYYI